MLIFPPFHMVWGDKTLNTGYAFLFTPPSPEGFQRISTVDIGMLLTQWAAVIIVGGALWLSMRK